MDPNIQQWAQTPEAQPYLQQYMPRQQAPSMGMGSMGGGGFSDYLIQLINQNQANPSFQQNMLGYYLDTMNPMNQPDPLQQQYQLLQNQMLFNQTSGYQGENLSNLALSLLSSDNKELQGYGMNLLESVLSQNYPGYVGEKGLGMSSRQPKSYEDIQRAKALEVLTGEGAEGLSPEDFEWYSFLANASDEEIRRYLEAKNKFVVNPWSEYWRGTGAGNPFDASAWSPEARARAKMGYTNY